MFDPQMLKLKTVVPKPIYGRFMDFFIIEPDYSLSGYREQRERTYQFELNT